MFRGGYGIIAGPGTFFDRSGNLMGKDGSAIPEPQPRWRTGSYPLLLLSILISSTLAFLPATVGAQGSPRQFEHHEITALELGKPIEREITGLETQQFQVAAAAGQFIAITIEQQGIDVSESVFSPEAKLLIAFDDELQPTKSERANFVAETAGVYRLDVQGKFKGTSGGLRIQVNEIRAATEKERRLHEARKLDTQAHSLFNTAQYEAAVPLQKKALEIAEAELGENDPLTAYLANELAHVYLRVADYAKAEQLYKRALAVNQAKLGPEAPQTIVSILGLGATYTQAGDFVKALEFSEQGMQTAIRTLGPDHLFVMAAVHDMALVHYRLGDYARAEQETQRAIAIGERSLSPDDNRIIQDLNDLGLIYVALKKYDLAESTLKESIELAEKRFGKDSFQIAFQLQNLGLIAQDHTKDYPKALDYYWRAVAIFEKSRGPDQPQAATILNNIANIYKQNGDYQKALELHQRVHAIAVKKLGPYGQLNLFSLGNIARTYAAMGDVPNAIKYQIETDQVIEKNLSLNLAIGSERQKLAYFDTLTDRTSRTISLNVNLAPTNREAANLAALVVLQRKGRVLDAISGSLQALRQRMNPDDQKLLDDLNATTSEYAALALNGPGKATAEDYQQRLSSLRNKKEDLEAEISKRSAEFRSQSREVTLAGVQAAIPSDAALIEFVVYRPFDPKKEPTAEAYGEPHYIAYVIQSRGEVQWRELGPAAEIDARLLAWRQSLSDPLRKDERELARAVDQKLMEPLRGLLGAVTHILVSPDGALNLVPLAALVDEHGRYLVETRQITYLTSGRDLLSLQVRRESRQPAVVFADPAFGEPPLVAVNAGAKSIPAGSRPRVDYSRIFFGPLPGAADEVRALKGLMPAAVFVTGEQATKEALKKLSGPALLHIATHGFFLTETGAATTGGASVAGTRTGVAGVKIENPLLRSGLALAGANQSGKTDGVLTALEAAGLNLWGTQLVVLSACDTGLGEVKNGDGVYGLRRAFVLAGAESQLMSLWPVSDRSTRDLIVGYYRALLSGSGRGAALRQAQLQMMKVKLHPYYWAGFIQTGEWADLDRKP
jgi:CHAT domain-containing protein